MTLKGMALCLTVGIVFVISLRAEYAYDGSKDEYGDTEAVVDTTQVEEIWTDDPIEQFFQGIDYFYGLNGFIEDNDRAFFWFNMSAAQGHPMAQYYLGLCYDKGYGVAKDKKNAVKLYRLAAEFNIDTAMVNLGKCYADGEGVIQDFEEACYWYYDAAQLNNPEAQYLLGKCYKEGKGIDTNDSEAYFWFLISTANGYSDAKYLRSTIEIKLTSELKEKIKDRAKIWFEKHEDDQYKSP